MIIPGMEKTEVRRIGKVRAKMNGIIIVPRIDIKSRLGIGRDCKMVICRRPFVITRVKVSCNQYSYGGPIGDEIGRAHV